MYWGVTKPFQTLLAQMNLAELELNERLWWTPTPVQTVHITFHYQSWGVWLATQLTPQCRQLFMEAVSLSLFFSRFDHPGSVNSFYSWETQPVVEIQKSQKCGVVAKHLGNFLSDSRLVVQQSWVCPHISWTLVQHFLRLLKTSFDWLIIFF